ncbi:hypothetical protein GQ53DRAFT_881735 [Thozetella sp. PMI_491]|nr:hypothetical protein GQ53DRAFT_881735 [Thozetella sp. PMI_491]
MSPVDPGDFITAIAAQERRVLELKEELNRAELELKRLKKQFARDESKRKLQAQRNVEPLRAVTPLIDLDDEGPARRSVEIDRRKALLLGQQSHQNTPERNRRRVFRGGHARTLSLLSPVKADGGFSVHEDLLEGPRSAREEPDSPYVRHYNPITPAVLAKRASWAPRSAHQQASAMKQIADDLKTGLWTFVEDLRQVAVGDEPITGQGRYLRGADGNMRAAMSRDDSYADNQETIRASGASSRPRVAAAFAETPTPASRFADVLGQDGAVKHKRTLSRSKTESSVAASKAKKHYSWTPLTLDDDEDWSSWESPNPQSTDRWSGSTVVDGNLIATIPEKGNENEAALKKASKSSVETRSPSPGTAAKLEELLPPVLNRLTPSNLKKHATDFMKEWERSLSPPEPATPVRD